MSGGRGKGGPEGRNDLPKVNNILGKRMEMLLEGCLWFV